MWKTRLLPLNVWALSGVSVIVWSSLRETALAELKQAIKFNNDSKEMHSDFD